MKSGWVLSSLLLGLLHHHSAQAKSLNELGRIQPDLFDESKDSPNSHTSTLNLPNHPNSSEPRVATTPNNLRIRNNVKMTDESDGTGYLWTESQKEGVYNVSDPPVPQHSIHDDPLKDHKHKMEDHPTWVDKDFPYPDYRNRLICPDCHDMVGGMVTYCHRLVKTPMKKRKNAGADDLFGYCESNFLPADNKLKVALYMDKDEHGSHAFTGTKHSECMFLSNIVGNYSCEPCEFLLNEPWNYGVPAHKKGNAADEICHSRHAGVHLKKCGTELCKQDNCDPPPKCEEPCNPCTEKPYKFEWEFCTRSAERLQRYCNKYNPKKTPEDFMKFCDDNTLGPITFEGAIQYNECKDFLYAMMIQFNPANPCMIMNGCPAKQICPVALPMCTGERRGWTQDANGNPVGPKKHPNAKMSLEDFNRTKWEMNNGEVAGKLNDQTANADPTKPKSSPAPSAH